MIDVEDLTATASEADELEELRHAHQELRFRTEVMTSSLAQMATRASRAEAEVELLRRQLAKARIERDDALARNDCAAGCGAKVRGWVCDRCSRRETTS